MPVSPLKPTPLEPPPNKQARRRQKVNLFTANLDALSYYDILGVRSDTSKPAIKQTLNEMLSVFLVSLDDDVNHYDENAQEEFRGNTINAIANTLQKAAQVLTSNAAKSIYDFVMVQKYLLLEWQIETLRPLITDTDNLLNSVGVLNNDVGELRDVVSQIALKQLVSNEINRRRSRGKRLRNTTTNRLRVQWQVNLSDETNGGITERYLLDYFSKYGEIVGSVMCSSRPGCAVLEFNSMQSVTDIISQEGHYKKFIVQDLSEAELISKNAQNELQQQIDELNIIAADVAELKTGLETTIGDDIEITVDNQ